MESSNSYSLLKGLAEALREVNHLLKRVKQLENERAALRAEIHRAKIKQTENELKALQQENQHLKRLKQLENEFAPLEMKNWRLQRMLLPDERAAVEAENCTTDWQDGVLAEEEIDSIQCADDPLAAAMPYVVAGHATFIEFSPDKLITTCGDFTREIQRSDAVAMDDWLALIGGIVEKPEQYCACSVLYSTDTRLILAEPLESEAIEELLRYIEASSSGRGERGQAPNWGASTLTSVH